LDLFCDFQYPAGNLFGLGYWKADGRIFFVVSPIDLDFVISDAMDGNFVGASFKWLFHKGQVPVVTVEVKEIKGRNDVAFACTVRKPSPAVVRVIASTYEVAVSGATKLLQKQGFHEVEFVRV